MKRKVIDVHAHIYPTAIAARAVESIKHFYEIETTYENGTVRSLNDICSAAGVERVVVHSVATTPKQVCSINNFIIAESEKNPAFVPFATLNPYLSVSEIRDEYARIKELGFNGVKLHPDCQHFALDGKEALRLLDCLDGDLPLLVHMGDKRFNFSNPKRLVTVAKEFPELKFIGAHFGGYSEWEYAEGYAGINNVWFDTSSSLAFLDRERAVEIIRELGVDRFMFGSDYPMWSTADEIERVYALGLTADEEEKIFYANAKAFLKL